MEIAEPERFENSLEGRTVVVAATASISVYRLPDIIRDLRREGAQVVAGMSEEAAGMISPEVMRWASGNPVITEITGDIEHISTFIDRPDDTLLLVCPASYNFIGKASSGISDDVPSLFFSFALGNGNPVIVSPVMHQGMMENPINRENLKKLERNGVGIIPPRIAEKKAKISESDTILDYVSRGFHGTPLSGKSILIIGGRGEERIDPVRNITNSGTGFTASWFLRNSFRLGASRIAFVGNTEFMVPGYVEHHPARFMDEYEGEVSKLLGKEKFDIVVNVASLSDFEPKEKFQEKISSSSSVSIHLEPRKKLNSTIREKHNGFLAVFKLARQMPADEIMKSFSGISPDLVIFNPYSEKGLPFGTVSNTYTAVSPDGSADLGTLSKQNMTMEVLRNIAKRVR